MAPTTAVQALPSTGHQSSPLRTINESPELARLILPTWLQGRHVDHEPVFDLVVEKAHVGLLNVLHSDHLDIGDNSLLRAKIEHLLRLGDAADHGASYGLPAEDHLEDGGRRMRMLRRAHQRQSSITLQQFDERIEAMAG